MTQQTDNVLVSREKWEKHKEIVCKIAFAYTLPWQEIIEHCLELAYMPDFIESERDVEVVAQAILDGDDDDSVPRFGLTLEDYKPEAQAAINALRYRKDGG